MSFHFFIALRVGPMRGFVQVRHKAGRRGTSSSVAPLPCFVIPKATDELHRRTIRDFRFLFCVEPDLRLFSLSLCDGRASREEESRSALLRVRDCVLNGRIENDPATRRVSNLSHTCSLTDDRGTHAEKKGPLQYVNSHRSREEKQGWGNSGQRYGTLIRTSRPASRWIGSTRTYFSRTAGQTSKSLSPNGGGACLCDFFRQTTRTRSTLVYRRGVA